LRVIVERGVKRRGKKKMEKGERVRVERKEIKVKTKTARLGAKVN